MGLTTRGDEIDGWEVGAVPGRRPAADPVRLSKQRAEQDEAVRSNQGRDGVCGPPHHLRTVRPAWSAPASFRSASSANRSVQRQDQQGRNVRVRP
jgi:hypothetical protein